MTQILLHFRADLVKTFPTIYLKFSASKYWQSYRKTRVRLETCFVWGQSWRSDELHVHQWRGVWPCPDWYPYKKNFACGAKFLCVFWAIWGALIPMVLVWESNSEKWESYSGLTLLWWGQHCPYTVIFRKKSGTMWGTEYDLLIGRGKRSWGTKICT